MSHPSWVRGLKPVILNDITLIGLSHPSWVRGLKQDWTKVNALPIFVAPLVGAWIETPVEIERKQQETVAPLVGAWIETCPPPINLSLY